MGSKQGAGLAGRGWGLRVGSLALLAAIAAAGATVGGGGSAEAAATSRATLQKSEPGPRVEPEVIDDILAGGGEATFFVLLAEKADLGRASRIAGRDARGKHVVDQLQRTAERSQAPLRAFLRSRDVAFQPYWAVNAIRVTGGLDLVRQLSARPDVRLVFADKEYELPEPAPAGVEPQVDGVEWGVERIKAPQVWAQGPTGAGIVVGTIDTGVQFDHPALARQYRGNLGNGTFDHNYNWHDPSSVCGSPSLVPCDNNGHGTHVTGTIVGDDRLGNQIGVAPGARWIAAKGCEANSCSGSALLSAGQWMLAPTDLNGQNADSGKRPHIVNNSWGGGASSDPWYRSLIQAWVAAGMFPQFANGNAGPGCGTAGNPGNTPEAYAAGSFDVNNAIANNSSRGPSAFSSIIKPNIAAPGVAIRSAWPGSGYNSISGTSMASPHVAGAIALLWQAAPQLAGDVAATRALLDQTAIDVSNTNCGGTAANNNVWGQGRLDVLAAFEDVPLGPSGTLTGTVTSSGIPLVGATVTITGPIERVATTNGSGVYTIALTQGTYALAAAGFGYVSDASSAAITAGGTTVRDFALVAAPSFTLSGTVRDNLGARLGGAPVEVLGTPLPPVTTDSNGNYSIAGVPQGAYHVRASLGRCYASAMHAVTVASATARDFTLPRRTDTFGHSCTLPTLPFEEASTVLPISGDEGMGSVTLPFAFPFYGGSYTVVNICTNGIVSFLSIPCNTPLGWTNRGIPDAPAPNAAIYPFWADLWVDSPTSTIRGEVKGTAPNRRYVIEFRNPRFYVDATKRVDFNAVLHENGDILMQYRNLGADGMERGNNATVGIENPSGTDALQYSFNEAVLRGGMSILFVPSRLLVPERPTAPGSGLAPPAPSPPLPPRGDPGEGAPAPAPPVPTRPGSP
jgi:subtilisin family serine protease